MGKSSTYNTWKLQLSYYKKWQLGPPRSQNEAASTNDFHPTYLSLTLLASSPSLNRRRLSDGHIKFNPPHHSAAVVYPPAPRAAAAVASSFLFQSEARRKEGREGGRGEIALLSLSHSASETAKKQNVKRAAWIKRRREARRGKGYTTTRRLLPFCGTAVAWHGRQAGNTKEARYHSR